MYVCKMNYWSANRLIVATVLASLSAVVVQLAVVSLI